VGCVLTLRVWSIDELMELVSSRKVGVYLTDLQELRGKYEERSRAGKARLGPGSLLSGFEPSASDADIDGAVACIKHIEELCEESIWANARLKASLVLTHIEYNRDSCDWSSLSADLRNIWDVVIADMWSAKLVKVLPAYSEYVNHCDLIPGDFRTKFPSAAEDIQEAGNCIAVDCGTAAVFHLMRGVEWGMRALSVDLGVLDVPRKKATIPIEFAEWERILARMTPAVNAIIDALPPGATKQELQEFYFPLLFDIRGFQQAFRNHVMHTRQSYSQKTADGVLDYVRRFFILLSTRVSE
jgi:hypothetical protein